MKSRRALSFPVSRPGEPLVPGREPVLAPGVRGYAIRARGSVYIPLIYAEQEGAGDVGRFLDSLPAWATIRIPNVTSGRLRGMLERRGWLLRHERGDFGDTIEVFVLPPRRVPPGVRHHAEGSGKPRPVKAEPPEVGNILPNFPESR